MRKIKGISTIFLSVAMLSTILTGCMTKSLSNETKSDSEVTVIPSKVETPKTEVEEEESLVQKPDSIHWMVHSGMKEENGTDLWVKEYEKLTGIKMNLEIVPNNEYESILDLAITSGTEAEVFDLKADQKLAIYAKQGAIADLTDLLMSSDLYQKVDERIWDSIRIDGKIYGIPDEIASGVVTYIREDWLERLGLKTPTNYEEFINVLRAFRDNIEECEVPLTAPGLSSNKYLPEFYQGAEPDFTKVDGVWVDGFAMDNMAEAMQRMQDAYKEGLIDLQVVTNSTTYCRDQWYNGGVGVFTYWAGNWGQTLKERLLVNVPSAKVLAMDPIEDAVYRYSVPTVFCISSKLNKDKIASIFKYFIEYMHDGDEGQVLFESGVKGVHWEQDGEYIKQLPALLNPEETFRKAWITPWMAISPLEVTDKKIKLDEAVTSSLQVLENYGVQNVALPVSKTFNKISDELNAYRDEILAKVVMGSMSVDEGMNLYRAKSVELNVEKVLEEMNSK